MLKSILMAVAATACLIGAAHAAAYVQKDRATLRALDKITGRSTDIQVKVDEPVVFGSLKVELKACYQTPPEEVPESVAFLKVDSTQPIAVKTMKDAVDAAEVKTVKDENPNLFNGWMFASTPGLSALEHPVYDIWVIRCTAPAPVKLPAPVIAPADEPLLDDVPPSLDTEPTPE